MNGLRKKMRKPPFLAKKANFGQFLAKMSKTGFFLKSAWNIFVAITSPKCKVSEKSNERIWRKGVANGQTDGQTNERTDKG